MTPAGGSAAGGDAKKKAILADTWSSRASVKIGGLELSVGAGGTGLLTEVSVRLSIADIDSATLTVYNWDEEKQARRYSAKSIQELLGLKATKDYPFALGQIIEVSMGYPNWEKKLFAGEVTRVTPTFGGGTSNITIEGSDGMHRLKGRTRMQTYKGTDSDIVQKVLDLTNKDNPKHKLKSKIEKTSESYDHVYQFDETDAAFLKERASRIGYEVYVRGDTLYFQPPDEKSQPEQLILEWGQTLEKVEVALNLEGQASSVEVRSADRDKKSVIKYETTSGDLQSIVGSGLSGAEAREKVFGAKPVVITRIPVRTKAEAKALAIARLRRLMEDFVKVRGTSIGLPDLRPGAVVGIKGIDPLFEGDYYLTNCSHSYGSRGYRTEFEARRMSL